MWDSGLDRFEENCIQEAIKEFFAAFPKRKIVIYGSTHWSCGNYSNADWYIQKAKRFNHQDQQVTQLDAKSVINLMLAEPWQKSSPHIDVCFTSKDLSIQGLNFCFGLTFDRCTVQSVYRYRGLAPEDRKIAIKSVFWHELGHVLGAARDLSRSNTEECLGPHCTNFGCVMRQGTSLLEWVKHARETSGMHMIYCRQCTEDIKKSQL